MYSSFDTDICFNFYCGGICIAKKADSLKFSNFFYKESYFIGKMWKKYEKFLAKT